MDEPRFDPDDPALLREILARTSGSPCRRLEALACDLVDGILTPAQASLAQGHLDHCPACRAMVASLRELQDVLPTLALLEPDAAFAPEVLQETCLVLPTFRTTWLHLMRRPRICLETAYLGTVAGLLMWNAPLPVLHPAALVARLGPPLEHMGPRLAQASPRLEAVRPQLHHAAAWARALEQRAIQTVARETRQARSFWDRVLTALRGWLLRLESGK